MSRSCLIIAAYPIHFWCLKFEWRITEQRAALLAVAMGRMLRPGALYTINQTRQASNVLSPALDLTHRFQEFRVVDDHWGCKDGHYLST